MLMQQMVKGWFAWIGGVFHHMTGGVFHHGFDMTSINIAAVDTLDPRRSGFPVDAGHPFIW